MREAFEEAMKGASEPEVASVVQEVAGEITHQEVTHEKFTAKVIDNTPEWVSACNTWTYLGREFNEAANLDEQIPIRTKAKSLIPKMLEWDTEGVAQLLRCLGVGLRRTSPISGTGLTMADIVESNQTGIPPIDLAARTFIDEFNDIFELEEQQSQDLDDFVIAQHLITEQTHRTYINNQNLFPYMAKWVQTRFAQN